MYYEIFSEEICKWRIVRRNLADKTVDSVPNSDVLYVEKNVMTHQRKTG
jgi:hypothetical protein